MRFFHEPNHPYTKGLLNCINNPEDDDKELTPIPGSPPDLLKAAGQDVRLWIAAVRL